MKRGISIIMFLMPGLMLFGQASILDHELVLQTPLQPASELLQSLSQEWGRTISYDSDLLTDRQFQFVGDTLTVQQAILLIFDHDALKIREVGKQIVVYRSDLSVIRADSCHRVLEGQVVDALTGHPVAKASVRIPHNQLMTVTNQDGKFILSLPCGSLETDITIAAPGYHTETIEALRPSDAALIKLKGSYIALQEIMILSVPVERIVGEVLKNVERNYLVHPTNSRAFFREAILRNGKLSALSEAVFYAYNRPYSTSQAGDQVKLLKGRKFSDLDTVTFKIKGSVKSCFDLDVIKNPPDFLKPRTAPNYEYNLTDIVEYDGATTYVISFFRRPDGKGLPYRGTMYIEKEKFSLRSISFSLNKKMLDEEEFFVVKSTRGAKTRFVSSSYFVNYTTVGDGLVMNYASIKTSFRVKVDKRLFYSGYETLSEYVVNQFETQNVEKIRNRDAFIAGKILMDEPMHYDPEYWKGVNYLPIDEPLTKASAGLKRILGQ